MNDVTVRVCYDCSGMRRDVDILIFLDVKKALEGTTTKCEFSSSFLVSSWAFSHFSSLYSEGMKLYVSDNKVILTEGFDGVVPVKYFQKIESWPQRRPIPF